MRSLVIGASGGIGAALAKSLATRGEVVALSRTTHGLEITDEASVAEHLGALSGTFDLIFTATGALGTPEKALRSLTAGELLSQVAINALGPALVLKHALRLMPRDRRCVFAALSARVGSIGDNSLGGWHSYRASKAALNQLLHGAAIEIARSHPQAIVAALHPGTVATPFTEGYGHDKHSPARAAADLLAVLDGLTPAQSGGFFDYSGATVPW
ncbi:SDR family NAD(P)-dependent oxidoreductase [Frigidibacter albus]|uniref:SDR family NAD(P)-dependent oxidoreductase n=1 Tax=Frigidibacter albus TaxID=1465486 RepID=A0A6L8VG23_9RHOB|nr:SDR family NAD(P)-dependent oxidoreductase [Frigidibacter albus]MZQ88606.1 SDR family NAD(P)-dependent oxidoreductase [Frigidibacter albus]NBE30585.1 SDR family NAD(P)-dependent oxidoreductase [Frigidibacter albus]GGH49415.1 SDR family oxidoreductase [Frigidibacter albus]